MDHLQSLIDRMRTLGAPDPEGWAISEVKEGIAQQARFLFLHTLWPALIDRFRDPAVLRRYPALERLLEQGADPEDLSRGVRAIAYETAFAMLNRVDDGADEGAPVDAPGWRLMEVGIEERLTGRLVGGLHESLQSLDPSGKEAMDLFE